MILAKTIFEEVCYSTSLQLVEGDQSLKFTNIQIWSAPKPTRACGRGRGNYWESSHALQTWFLQLFLLIFDVVCLFFLCCFLWRLYESSHALKLVIIEFLKIVVFFIFLLLFSSSFFCFLQYLYWFLILFVYSFMLFTLASVDFIFSGFFVDFCSIFVKRILLVFGFLRLF